MILGTLQVLRAANLSPSTGRVKLVVADRKLARSKQLIDFLVAKGSTLSPAIRILGEAVTIPEARDASLIVGDADAVVVTDATPKSMNALTAFSMSRHVLTISYRPQDLGVASVIVLPSEIYYDDTRLSAERITLDPQMKENWIPVTADDYKSRYAEARRTRNKERSNVDWVTIVINLRMAILAKPDEDRRPISLKVATSTDPYLPHLRLSEALAKLGDCAGARNELEISNRYPHARDALAASEVKGISTTVSNCQAPLVTAVTRAGPFTKWEELWRTNSF